MKETPAVRKTYRIAKLSVIAGIVVFFAVWWFQLRPSRHQHCIKAATFILFEYAEQHGGAYPRSERGWGDAILSLGSGTSDTSWVSYFVGVDDDGSRLIRAMMTGEDVIENECTRIYVQGLNNKTRPGIAILFDRDSVKGGDHFRGLIGQERLREVITTEGTHQMIKDTNWPTYVAQQRELLKNEGFTNGEITRYYGPETN